MPHRNLFTLDNDGTLRYYNGVPCGVVYKEVDGYYVWVPPEARQGCLEAYHLTAIARMLNDMNADWDAQVRNYFNSLYQQENDPLRWEGDSA